MTSNTTDHKKRRPLSAFFLSMAATGLGHIYCGKLAKGLTLFFVSFAFAPIVATLMKSASSAIALGAVIVSIGVLVFVFVYAAIDSIMIARKMGHEYQLREYNRWYIYLLFIIVSVAYPTNLSNHTREHLVQAYKIPSISMAPNILKKDFILLNKVIYKRKRPQRGEVVVFVCPNDRRLDYVKRIVAMPGDTVEMKDNVLFVNNVPLTYETIDRKTVVGLSDEVKGTVMVEKGAGIRHRIVVNRAAADSGNFEKVIVPNGHCFVLGDNRSASQDSRYFGPVPLADVKGRVDFIYIPAASWSRFGKFES